MTNIFTTANAQAYADARKAARDADSARRQAELDAAAARRRVKFIEAIYDPALSHARATYFQGKPSDVLLYKHDPESPSGVTLAASLGDFDQAVALLDAAGVPFPLSPTEGLRTSA